MNTNDSEELLALINRLLEQLHQTGPKNLGVRIQIVLEPEAYPKTLLNPFPSEARRPVAFPCLGREKIPVAFPYVGREIDAGELPEVLATDEAMALWRKAQQAGYVDEHYQPLLSRTQAALLADAMAERLGIKEKWKTFGELWKRNNMRGDYTRAMNQRQSLGFQDKLKRLFSTDNEENTGKT